MDYNRPMKINRRRKKNVVWQVLGLILFAVSLSFGIAAVWQNMDQEGTADLTSHSMPAVQSEAQSSTPQISSSQEASSEEPKVELPVADGAVVQSERVKSTYFDDAVFVGDSITTGIQLYDVMANTKVLAGTGINLGSIYTEPVVKLEDGSRITIMDGLAQAQYKKVYVMLGGNEVRDQEKDAFIARYGEVIDDIKALQPDAVLYVQSILPVTKQNNYNMDNERIDDFNAALIQLCEEKKVYYLNVAESMKDEEGVLPDQASPADGMHFGPDYYNKWFEYLKTHVVTN